MTSPIALATPSFPAVGGRGYKCDFRGAQCQSACVLGVLMQRIALGLIYVLALVSLLAVMDRVFGPWF
jgi:hypothetical protein